MSEVYVVIWEDRHSDTEIQVFANAAEAVLWASEAAKGSDRFDELKEYFYDKPDECPADLNWVKRTSYLYFGQYSCEGDHIEVRKATVRSV
jgi:hypothetical protein